MAAPDFQIAHDGATDPPAAVAPAAGFPFGAARQSNCMSRRMHRIYAPRVVADTSHPPYSPSALEWPGPNFPDLYRRAGDYVDKILRGTKPAEIPVEQPTKFDLVINLTIARALDLEVPPSLLAIADEVIECVVRSGGLRLPCSIIAEHSIEGCDHFSHDSDDDDLGFFVGVGEAFVEGLEGGTVSACAEGGHVEDITDRHSITVDAAVSLELAAVEVIWCKADEGGDLFAEFGWCGARVAPDWFDRGKS